MYRPYAIRPTWQARRELLKAALCYGGGGTSSTPLVPPEFAPLINTSVRNMVAQQGQNPIGQYNAANPMGVEGLTPSQQYAMSQTFGAGQQSPLEGLMLQAAQRSAGMAGTGPLTGSYDPSGEMGLQDWAQLMNPTMGMGGEMGDTRPPQGIVNYTNMTPSPVQGTDYSGGVPNMSLPPPGAGLPPGGGSGGGGGGYLGGGGDVNFHPGATGGQAGAPVGGGAAYNQTSGSGNNPFMYGADYLRRQYGHNIMGMDPSQIGSGQLFQTDANGFPIGPGGTAYTGAQHEWGGGTTSLADAFQNAGMTPDDYARWLVQGEQARRNLSTSPLAQQRHAAGQDDFGNQIAGLAGTGGPAGSGSFLDRLRQNHQSQLGTPAPAPPQTGATPPNRPTTPPPRPAPRTVTR